MNGAGERNKTKKTKLPRDATAVGVAEVVVAVAVTSRVQTLPATCPTLYVEGGRCAVVAEAIITKSFSPWSRRD